MKMKPIRRGEPVNDDEHEDDRMTLLCPLEEANTAGHVARIADTCARKSGGTGTVSFQSNSSKEFRERHKDDEIRIMRPADLEREREANAKGMSEGKGASAEEGTD